MDAINDDIADMYPFGDHVEALFCFDDGYTKTFTLPSIATSCAFFSKNEVVYADQKLIKVLNCTTHNAELLRGHRDNIVSVRCAGDLIYSGSHEGALNVWDPHNVALQWANSMQNYRRALTSIAVSRGEGIVLSTTKDGYMCVWDQKTSLQQASELIDNRGLYSAAICDDIDLFALGGYSKVHLYTKSAVSHFTTLGGHTGPVYALAAYSGKWAPAGIFVSGGEDKNLCVWSMDTMKCQMLRKHCSGITCLSILDNDTDVIASPLLFSGSRDRTIILWKLTTGEPMRTYTGHSQWILSLSVLDGPRPMLLSSSQDKTLKIWSIYKVFNWERRKAFMMFLIQSHLMMTTSTRAVLSMPLEYNTGNAVSAVLGCVDICRQIMSFL